MNRLALLLVAVCCSVPPAFAADMEITPFRTVNQGALVQIFGFPAESSATITPAGHTHVTLTQDMASSYVTAGSVRESLILDGESCRWTLAACYGIGERFEVGVSLLYILSGGGFLDSFINDWHTTFNLPQGGRDAAPSNRIRYGYRKDGIQRLLMERAGSGMGDISLTGGMRLYDLRDETVHDSLALRASLKLPTGDSGSLRGSGSSDVTLSLCGGMNNFTEWGALGLFGSLGAMALTNGDLLPGQQNNLVGFGTVGLGWGPAEWISFKIQLNAHTPLYRDSSLHEISGSSLMLVSGGTLKLSGAYLLDIGISEDVAVGTAPDVAFHLGLSRRF